MNRAVLTLGALALGLAAGFAAARWTSPAPAPDTSAPGDWLARVGGEYLTRDQFIDAMRQRGGMRPGQFHEPEQRQALLDQMVYQKALVAEARSSGIADLPEVRHTLDQVLANQVLQRRLREQQKQVVVPDEAVRAFYDANVESYAIPARRRVAMIAIPVPAGAEEPAWQSAEAEATEALQAVGGLGEDVRHFGAVAREYSHDQASRYRGGVIGWLSEQQRDRYHHDPVVLEAAFALQQPGELSPVLRGAEGVYLLRLVDLQPEQARSFEQLADGIRQRLVEERMAQVEAAFRAALLERVSVEVREDLLADIAPLAPPPDASPPQPPAMPAEGRTP